MGERASYLLSALILIFGSCGENIGAVICQLLGHRHVVIRSLRKIPVAPERDK